MFETKNFIFIRPESQQRAQSLPTQATRVLNLTDKHSVYNHISMAELAPNIAIGCHPSQSDDIENTHNFKSQVTTEFIDSDKCTVCHDGFDASGVVVKLVCGHMFHNICIQTWLRYKSQCPLCRTTIARIRDQ